MIFKSAFLIFGEGKKIKTVENEKHFASQAAKAFTVIYQAF